MAYRDADYERRRARGYEKSHWTGRGKWIRQFPGRGGSSATGRTLGEVLQSYEEVLERRAAAQRHVRRIERTHVENYIVEELIFPS